MIDAFPSLEPFFSAVSTTVTRALYSYFISQLRVSWPRPETRSTLFKSVCDWARLYVTTPVHPPEHFGEDAGLLAATAARRWAVAPGASRLKIVSTKIVFVKKVMFRIVISSCGEVGLGNQRVREVRYVSV